jgi:hypothetical protein
MYMFDLIENRRKRNKNEQNKINAIEYKNE